MRGSARKLSDGGWGLKVRPADQVACIRATRQLGRLHANWSMGDEPSHPRQGAMSSRPCFGEEATADTARPVPSDPAALAYGWSIPTRASDRCATAQEEGRKDLSDALAERAQARRMEKVRAGDLEGPAFPVEQYLLLRGSEVVGNPRQTEEYGVLLASRLREVIRSGVSSSSSHERSSGKGRLAPAEPARHRRDGEGDRGRRSARSAR